VLTALCAPALFCLALTQGARPAGNAADKKGLVDYEAVLNDRLGKGVTPEKNANALLWKALGPRPEGEEVPAEYFKRLGIEAPPPAGDYFLALDLYLKEHRKLERDAYEAAFDQEVWAARRPWAAKDYPHLAAWLKANNKPMAVVVAATRRPQYFSPLVSRRTKEGRGLLLHAPLANVRKCWELANALAARAMLRVGESKYDEAWQDLLACHRLGRLVARGATFVEALVGIAIDQVASQADLAYLERARLTSKQVRDRLKDLQALSPNPPMVDLVDLAERFVFLDFLQELRLQGPGMLGGTEGVATKLTPEVRRRLESIDWVAAQREGNRWYDRMVAALRQKARPERGRELDKIVKDLKALKKRSLRARDLARLVTGKAALDKGIGKQIGELLVVLLLPAAREGQAAHDRAEQAQRNLHVAFALAAYQRDHARYPAQLAALAPKYLAKVPDDIFSGKPLIYRPSEKGYLLYSIGPNGKDDGGRWYDDDPPGDDPHVRMPLPTLKKKR
jgi:hypothetical protein